MSFSTRVGVQTPRTVAVFAALSMFVALLPVFLAPLPAHAIEASPESPIANPNLSTNSCGLDVILLLDETGSMAGEEGQMETAYDAFIDALVDSGSRVGVLDFSSRNPNGNSGEADATPGAPDDVSPYTSAYIGVTATSVGDAGALGSYTGPEPDGYEPDGYTNWQEALWGAANFEANGQADLVIFFTDGDPNTVDANTPGYNGTNGELSSGTDQDIAASWAVEYSNDLKGGGTHVLGLGLGLGSGASTARLASVTGPDGATNPAQFNVATTDYVTFSDPADIATALNTVATALCNTKMTVTKYVSNNPDAALDINGIPVDSGDFTKASGWTFSLSGLTSTGGSAFVGNSSGQTNGSGSVNFAWRNNVRTDTSSVDLAETIAAGHNVLGGECSWNGGNKVLNASASLGTIAGIPDQATVSCNVYNDPGFLTLSKIVQNDDGGTADPEDFTLNASGPTNISGKSGSGSVTGAPVAGGGYTLSEDAKSGYTQVGDWNCGNATVTGGNSVTIAAGAHILCTVTNTDGPPTLTLVKVVDNSNGGSAVTTDWKLSAKEQAQGSGSLSGNGGASGNVPGGLYDLTETSNNASKTAGYNASAWDCSGDGWNGQVDINTIDIASGDDVTCEITNTARIGHLKLVKSVSNAYGTNESGDSWTLSADGAGTASDFDGEGVVESDVPAGDYALSESGLTGWSGSEWSCGSATYDTQTNTVSIGVGESATCTITNRPTQPELTLVKDLILGPGANETTDDFLLKATGPVSIQGNSGKTEVTEAGVNVGSYALSESGPSGYSQIGGWICIGGSQDEDEISLAAGESATCTVTNASNPAKITLVKDVSNSNGGLAKSGDFQLTLNGDNAPQGVNTVVPNTEYTVSEQPVSGYSYAGVVCKDGDITIPHPVTLDEGQEAICTITNVDQPGVLTVVKQFAHETSAQPDDFDLTLNGEVVESGETNFVPGNETYTVDETVLEGWTQISLTCVEGEQGEIPIDHPVELSNGQSVVCTIVNGEIPTITVEKIAIGDDEAEFVFTGDLGEFSFTEEGGSNTWDVEPGEYNVVETPAEFWALTGIDCRSGAVGDLNGAEASFELGFGQHQKCTFTNERLPESIEVLAEGVCENDAPYLRWIVNPVNFDGTEVTITWLDIDPSDPLYQSTGNPMQGMMLWPGAVLDGDGKLIDWPGWINSGGVWSQGVDGYQDTLPTAAVMFTVDPEIVVQVGYPDCGGPPAQIIIEKQVTGEASQEFEFVFNTSGFVLDDDTLAHGDQGVSGDLEPGDGYSVSETVPDGWEQVSATCDDGSDPSNIELSVGETVTCTFVNTVPDVVEPIEILPFTGMYADEMAALATVLAIAGALAVIASRRRKEQGLES